MVNAKREHACQKCCVDGEQLNAARRNETEPGEKSGTDPAECQGLYSNIKHVPVFIEEHTRFY